MSLHSSLKRADKASKGRSILKRTERIKWMMGKGLWGENSRPFALPKIKIVKLKVSKKGKKEEVPKEEKKETKETK